ncbi:hypothetical protein Aperf_G00000000798 [Anoplocephala perfoliata]
MEQRNGITFQTALYYIKPTDLKNILLKAPIQKLICDLTLEQFAYYIRKLPQAPKFKESDKVVHAYICRDGNFSKKMAEFHPETLQFIVQKVECVEYFFLLMDPSIMDEIWASGMKRLNELAPKQYLDVPYIVDHLYSDMPNIDPSYANIFFEVNCGYIQFIIDNHPYLPNFLVNMDAKNLLHVEECYPNLAKKLVELPGEALHLILANMEDMLGFLNKLDSGTARRYCAKLPEVCTFLQRQLHRTASILRSLGEKDGKLLEAKMPSLFNLLDELPIKEENMPKVIKLLKGMPDADVEAIEAFAKTVNSLLASLGVEKTREFLEGHRDKPAHAFFLRLLNSS